MSHRTPLEQIKEFISDLDIKKFFMDLDIDLGFYTENILEIIRKADSMEKFIWELKQSNPQLQHKHNEALKDDPLHSQIKEKYSILHKRLTHNI
jgi:hypothetical protein